VHFNEIPSSFGDDTQNDFEKEYDISVKIKIAN
jgi:hypothetical protein